MHIEWTPKHADAPYFFRQAAEWNGLKVHRAHVQPGCMPAQTAEMHEINVTLGGAFVVEKISATGKAVRTKSGTGHLCLTPSGQTVAAHWSKPLKNLGLLLNPDFVRRSALENGFSDKFEFREIYRGEDPLVTQIGMALLSEHESPADIGRLYADSLVQTLTLHMLRNYSDASARVENTNGGLSGYRLRRVTDFIEANLDEDVSLSQLAEVAGLSQFHFARAFRKSTGETPQHYLNTRRIERAKELLTDRELPLVEVGLRTGFKSQSHFTTLFRKFTNQTPRLWRELRLS